MFTFNSSPGRNSLSSILTNSQGDRHELSTATTGCPEARQKKIIPSKQEIIPSKKYESSNDKKDRLNININYGAIFLGFSLTKTIFEMLGYRKIAFG